MRSEDNKKILLVEDSDDDYLAICLTLKDFRYEIIRFSMAEDALGYLISDQVSLIIADFNLPGMSGFEFLQHPIHKKISVPTVLMARNGNELLAVKAIRAGIDEYVIKDVANHYLESLPLLIERAIKHFHLQLKIKSEQQKNALQALIIENMKEGICITNQDNEIININTAFTEITGYALQDIQGKNPSVLSSYIHDSSFYKEMWDELKNNGYWAGKVINRNKSGATYTEWLTIICIYNGQKVIEYYIGIFSLSHSELELQRFQVTLDQTLDCIFMFDSESLKFFYVNQGAIDQLGFSRDELLEYTPLNIKPDFNRENFLMLVSPLLDGTKKALTFQTVHQHKDGSLIPVEILLQLVSTKGERGRFVAIVRDITERKHTEDELLKYREHLEQLVEQRTAEIKRINHSLELELDTRKKTEKQLRLAAEIIKSANEGIVVTDPKGIIVSVNPAFTKITGYSLEEAIGNNPKVLKSNKHDKTYYRNFWHSLVEKGHWKGVFWNCRKNGELYPQLTSISAIKDAKDNLEHYVAVTQDVTDYQRNKDEIKYKAYHDPLTDLPNRSLFLDRLSHAIERASRKKNKMAILFLDLDDFKQANDTFGHEAGDSVLQTVATRLLGMMRKEDTVSRLGGDEFLILVENINLTSDINVVAEKIITSIQSPLPFKGNDIYIGASMGIAIYPLDAQDSEALIKKADFAMYYAKNKGKNNFKFYQEVPHGVD
ncbi:hypothetical protein AU255_07015 [Methyloprofundus sedimenti]|uniref:Diguanylate cyclase n=1 Tax=Methyloprofundus sedimenti TaxID=1420851 RepID=A0A1V8M7V8_9GAMM|nr:PAS domain S-box protein [Methyloprofundus sedimenti]OQK17612.1 hypothetical protein AU255_07015 [Methyloprofundus sedimenti]